MSLKSVLSKSFLLFNNKAFIVSRVLPVIRVPPTRALPSWGPPTPKTDRKDIEFRVLKTLSLHDKIDSKQLKLESHLVKDLSLDSLDLIEIVVQLEDEFKVEISDTETDRLLTIESIIDYLVEKQDKTVDQNKRPDIEFKEGMVDTYN